MEEKNPEPENTLKSNCGVKVSHMAKFTTKTVSLGMKIYKHVKGKVPTFFYFCKSFFYRGKKILMATKIQMQAGVLENKIKLTVQRDFHNWLFNSKSMK